jgi:hypothetical protein
VPLRDLADKANLLQLPEAVEWQSDVLVLLDSRVIESVAFVANAQCVEGRIVGDLSIGVVPATYGGIEIGRARRTPRSSPQLSSICRVVSEAERPVASRYGGMNTPAYTGDTSV